MAVNASEYAVYLLNNIPPETMRRKIISEAKVLPAGSKLPEEYIDYFVEEWGGNSGAFQNIETSNEILFMFTDVERGGNNSDLVLFTPNSGTVYKINNENSSIKPEFLGFINGFFEPSEISSQEISTSEPEFLDIKIGGETYQVLK